MDELINNTWEQWKAAKSAAQSLCNETARYDMAQKLGACAMFKGTESLEDLVKLMFTPRGIEFMTRFHFPDIDTFRKFKPMYPERYGVYIDCGEISLSEARKVFFGRKHRCEIEVPGHRKQSALFNVWCCCPYRRRRLCCCQS